MRAAFPLFLLALTACSVRAEQGHELTDSNWRFLTIDGTKAVSDRAAIVFRSEEFGASVGCNQMTGTWRVEDQRLLFGPLTQTEMYCEGRVWDQERAVGALLAGAPRVTLEGDRLHLASSGHEAELELLSRQQQAP